MGKGQTIKEGFKHSKGHIISYIDADMPINPKQIQYYLNMLENADVVITSKRHPESNIRYPLHRRVLSRCFNILVRILLRLPFSDTQCGFKFFKRSVLEEAIPRLFVKRYAFDVEILLTTYKRGYIVIEAPITFGHGEERINLRDIFKMGSDLLSIFYRNHFTKIYN
jgi:glycosyltransferase involved in cell wall biosynthesis